MWERRYAAVQPSRDPAGQRVYTDADIERLILLRAATAAGRSIGQVARLSTEAITALVDDDRAARARSAAAPSPELASGSDAARAASASTADTARTVDIVDSALALARSLDEQALDAELRRAAAVLGISPFIEEVAAPLMRRVGDEWHAGRLSIAPEHLATSILHDILADAMRAVPAPPRALRVLIATPAGDRHAVGAALVGAQAAAEGMHVLYLGPDLPAHEIADAAVAAAVHVVALSVVYLDNPARVLGELRALRARLRPSVRIIAGGAGARPIASDLAAMAVDVETSIPGFVARMRRLAAASSA